MTVDTHSFREQLVQGVSELAIDLPESQVKKLVDYLSLLVKWNAVYNLTAVRDPALMVTQHLLDCLATLPAFINASRVLDVGSGGGLPGVMLAIWAQHAQPQMSVHMIDTVHKKTAFLTQAKSELGLSNVQVHTGRVEQLNDEKKFDVITSRAFAELKDFVLWSGHLLTDGGKMIALKGQPQESELVGLPAGWEITKLEQINVPGLAAQRHLVHIERMTNR
ncbi:MAG: 16S rRNA (guanine(527)-N(7))-methyltransferase RsmG [Oxalobacteraceae bacterium]|jgi:16S rRNA (guanine527-N7)-methyltransferase|nr:16S rRNA (guanine(527)-N(7))-methyltransferase RsmG [Oxalobacteraceae bacterium]